MPIGIEEGHPAETIVRQQSIAPWIHTAFILAVLLLWASYGALRTRALVSSMPHPAAYISTIIFESLLVGSTIAGLYRRRQFIFDVMGSFSKRGLLRDVGIGFATYVVGLFVAGLVGLMARSGPLHLAYRTDIVRALVPRGFGELALWMVLSAAAGTCEEFIFRGYLQRQLTGWFRSASVAIAVCSILFGCLHFYQGVAGVFQVAALGAVYGIVAQWRGNLRSVMIAHFLQDSITGLVLFLRFH